MHGHDQGVAARVNLDRFEHAALLQTLQGIVDFARCDGLPRLNAQRVLHRGAFDALVALNRNRIKGESTPLRLKL